MYNRQTESTNPFGYDTHAQFSSCGDFFQRRFHHGLHKKEEWKQKMRDMFAGRKSANIQEDESNFIISLYAAGLVKDNFKVSVSDDVLHIQYNAPEEATDNKFVHREYKPVSFGRSFQLNNRALTEDINASYIDGVLKIILRKNPETNKPAQEVNVA